MQPNVLDALLYIFDVVLDDMPPGDDMDTGHIEQALSAAGFPQRLIDNAMDWLMDLADAEGLSAPSTAIRLYAPEETARLDVGSRSRLVHLEHQGILSAANRERVIERLLALDSPQITANEVDWVTLMVLQADRAAENEFNAMEGVIFDPAGACLH
ncbi:MAG: DUF494 domain-containing protein [Oceanococcaceae bacterium]